MSRSSKKGLIFRRNRANNGHYCRKRWTLFFGVGGGWGVKVLEGGKHVAF